MTTTPEIQSADSLVGVQGGVFKQFPAFGLSSVINGPISYRGGYGTAWRIVGSDVSETTRNFNVVVCSFPGMNLPGSSRQNTVAQIGWNQNPNGTPEDPTDGTLVLSFEEHYMQNGAGVPAFEWHLATIDTAGVAHRPITGYFPKDGVGGRLGLQADVIEINDYTGAQVLQLNCRSKHVQIFSGVRFVAVNNEQVYKQRNVGNSADLPLPWIDHGDQVRCAAKGLAVVGAAPSAGDYAGRFVTLACTSGMADGATFLKGYLPAVTGSISAFSFSGSITGTLVGQVFNQSLGAAADAVVDIVTSGRDAYAMFRTSTAEWSVGVDKSDGKFKAASGNGTLGAADRLSLDSFGNLRLAGSLGVGNSAAAATLGAVVKKMEIFDAAGVSLGFVPIYESIA